jgi:hypothetical protein
MWFTTLCFAGLMSVAWVQVTGMMLQSKQGGGSEEGQKEKEVAGP